ncbi:hypothetical protein OG21DRAFT_1522516 [Imleria badia]|nr:hypothetical protein OG21DRAFT_1522516 [Imleria badia]
MIVKWDTREWKMEGLVSDKLSRELEVKDKGCKKVESKRVLMLGMGSDELKRVKCPMQDVGEIGQPDKQTFTSLQHKELRSYLIMQTISNPSSEEAGLKTYIVMIGWITVARIDLRAFETLRNIISSLRMMWIVRGCQWMDVVAGYLMVLGQVWWVDQ